MQSAKVKGKGGQGGTPIAWSVCLFMGAVVGAAGPGEAEGPEQVEVHLSGLLGERVGQARPADHLPGVRGVV